MNWRNVTQVTRTRWVGLNCRTAALFFAVCGPNFTNLITQDQEGLQCTCTMQFFVRRFPVWFHRYSRTAARLSPDWTVSGDLTYLIWFQLVRPNLYPTYYLKWQNSTGMAMTITNHNAQIFTNMKYEYMYSMRPTTCRNHSTINSFDVNILNFIWSNLWILQIIDSIQLSLLFGSPYGVFWQFCLCKWVTFQPFQ